MTPEIPDEIKKWIEDEAENLPEKYGWENDGTAEPADIKRAAKDLATSLYQHLQENGRVAELEDQLKKSLDLYNNQTETIIKLEKEIEGWRAYKENIDQALNSGDGVYRP